MIPLDQQDYVKYYQMYKGNFYKGAAILRAQLTNPTMAEAIVSTPAAIATIYASCARSNVDALCANEMYYAGYGKQLTEAALASKGYTDNLATILNSTDKLYALVSDQSMVDYVWNNMSVTRNAFKGIQTANAILSDSRFRTAGFSLNPKVTVNGYDDLVTQAKRTLIADGYSNLFTQYSMGRTCWANSTYYYTAIAYKTAYYGVVVAVNLRTLASSIVFKTTNATANYTSDFSYPVIKVDNVNKRLFIAYVHGDSKTRLTALNTDDNSVIFNEVSLNETGLTASYPIFDILFNATFCGVLRQASSISSATNSGAVGLLGYTTVNMTGTITSVYVVINQTVLSSAVDNTHEIYAQLGNIHRAAVYRQYAANNGLTGYKYFYLSGTTVLTDVITCSGTAGYSGQYYVPYIITDSVRILMIYNYGNTSSYSVCNLSILLNHTSVYTLGANSYNIAIHDIAYDLSNQRIYLYVKRDSSSTLGSALSSLVDYKIVCIDLLLNTAAECNLSDVPLGLPKIFSLQTYMDWFTYNYHRYVSPIDDMFNGLTFRSDLSHLYNMLSDSKPGFVTEEDLQ